MELSGNAFDYVIAFWSGILTSFTPCVYPVMPITASFIAGMNVKGTKLMGFVLSLIYVFGLAIVYCALGVVAALSGKIFGQLQNSPLIFILVASVLTFFALVMFDVIAIPTVGSNVQSKIKTRNLWTVILFGMTAGLIVGPCTAPVLGTLLLYVASKQNIFHAVSLLFVFAYGVGASLILVGTCGGFLANLPKAGIWLTRIKKFCGFILLRAGGYFLIKAARAIL